MGPVDEVRSGKPAPASRTDAVKSKLKKQQAPKLADVLKEIDDATDATAMRKAGEPAAHLADDSDKAQARAHWQKKLETSRAQKTQQDEGTAQPMSGRKITATSQ